MHVDEQAGVAHIPPGMLPAPPPGQESAGPPLTQLEVELVATRKALEALYASARLDARERTQAFAAQMTLDANGDGAVMLFTVPAGCVARIGWLSVDEPGVTLAAPDTNANLWHAIYGASAAGATEPEQVVAAGALLDGVPQSSAASAQIPFTYLYGTKHSMPLLQGGATFYLVVDAATASRLVVARGSVLVEQAAH